MTHLHRLPEDVDPSDIPRTPLELFRVAHREVDPDIAYQKRSYNAMELLCSGTSVINRLYSTKSDIISIDLNSVPLTIADQGFSFASVLYVTSKVKRQFQSL